MVKRNVLEAKNKASEMKNKTDKIESEKDESTYCYEICETKDGEVVKTIKVYDDYGSSLFERASLKEGMWFDRKAVGNLFTTLKKLFDDLDDRMISYLFGKLAMDVSSENVECCFDHDDYVEMKKRADEKGMTVKEYMDQFFKELSNKDRNGRFINDFENRMVNRYCVACDDAVVEAGKKERGK